MCTRERPMWLHPWKLLFMVQKGKKTQPRGETPPSPLAFCFKKMLCFKTGLGMGVSTTPEVQHSNRFTARRLPIIYGLKA